jgi:PAS domain S-box-containing protein
MNNVSKNKMPSWRIGFLVSILLVLVIAGVPFEISQARSLVAIQNTVDCFVPWHFHMTLFLAVTGFLAAIGLAIWQRYRTAHYQSLYLAETRLHASVERHSITLKAIGDAVISTDSAGRVELINPVAEVLTGWAQSEAFGRPLDEVFHIINENTRRQVEDPVAKVLRQGTVVGLTNHTLLIAKDGREIPIADSAAPIRDEQNAISGVVLIFRDQTEERRAKQLLQARLTLLEFASTNSLDKLLSKALDVAGEMVNSPIGFYHFVGADEKTIYLQQWSTRTLKEFCQAERRGIHYDIENAGVWADAVRQKKPIIHNNYALLPQKKGMPEGHAEVVREMVVPIMRNDKVVAILGVGNKPYDYTEKDLETVIYLADVTWEIVSKKIAEENLTSERQRLANIIEGTNVGTWEWNIQTGETVFNEKWVQIIGHTLEELSPLNIDTWLALTHPEDVNKSGALLKRHFSGETPSYDLECRMKHKNGQWVWVHDRGRVITWTEDGKPLMMFGTHTDITERKEAEEQRETLQTQLNQAQKMESVGRLAGGIAHDYNNMLGVILGHAEMALMHSVPTQPLFHHLQAITKAAERSADLTRQLLAFARKQTITPKLLNLNEIVEGMLMMLKRLIGEDIHLAWIPGKELWPVKVDPTQLDQIIANLCINSCDAISGVGKITIETTNIVFDRDYCSHHADFAPGNFVMLAVSDDGCGMDKETLDKIFDPFFTTKEFGKGTGLGLAIVYGIVKQNNGFINVYTEPGQGTTLKIYLPRHAALPLEAPVLIPEPVKHGHETILLVEDETEILEITKMMLEDFGYSVLTASKPAEAICLTEKYAEKINLVITDVVMPEMNGRDLAKILLSLSPDLKSLFMSGYTADVIAHRGVLDGNVNFIQKPFSAQSLGAKVREALDDQ